MIKIVKLIFWLVIVAAVMVGVDQFLVRMPADAPGVGEVQKFYVDFRQRLFSLVGIDNSSESIETVIEASNEVPVEPQNKASRYLYVDADGALQFADSLEQVPFKYRKDAQPLAD